MIRLVSLVLALTGIAIGGLWPSPAAALDLAVNDTADAADAAPGDGSCADATGQCTLRAAIEDANALPGSDRILLPPGVYTLAPAAGPIAVTDDLSIEGGGADVTIVDGGGVIRTLEVSGTQSFALAGLTLRNAGVAVLATGVRSVALADCIVQENLFAGISISQLGPGADVQVARCEIRSNGPNGIELFGAITASIADSLVTDNGKLFGIGFGNGLWALGGRVFIQRTRVLGNHGSGIGGEDAFFEIRESHVAENSGAGLSTTSSNARIVASTFSGNDTGLSPTRFDSVTLIDTTVSGNRIGIRPGSGIRSFLRGATITNNDVGLADLGGLLSNLDRTRLSNVVLAGNGQDCQTSEAAIVESEGYNLIGDSTGCTIADADGDQVGAPGSPIDPRLGPLADNGGPTPTHAPQPDSPLIDAGSPALPGTSEAACSVFDQHGVARLQDGDGDGVARCDIGAVERPGATVPAIATSPSRYDFGQVAVGGESTQILTISNVGSATLTVSGVALQGVAPGFVLDPPAGLPAALEPGEHVDVGLRFLPGEEGANGAWLRVTSDDPERPLLQVQLGGTGVLSDDEHLALLGQIDDAVAAGELTGTGPGSAAEERLAAFRNLVEASEDLLDQGRLREACGQLETARRRADGASPPPDLVEGSATESLHSAIAELRSERGCDTLRPPTCGLGAEAALALAAITRLRKRRTGRVPA